MNTYSKALRYINMKDVKQKHHQKLVERKILEEEYKKLLNELKYNNSSKYSNWRSEIVEQMTTTDIFATTLPATGNVEYPVSDTAVQIDTYAVEYTIDTSVYDTLVFDVTLNGDKTLGIFSSDINLIKNITSSGIHSFAVNQSKQLKLIAIVSLAGEGSVSVNDIRAKRQTPLNVFIPLDSPEATSFIRSDPMFDGLSPEEKLKKLKEMLEASDEYTAAMFGDEFPGSGATPPGEAGDTPGVEIAQISDTDPKENLGQPKRQTGSGGSGRDKNMRWDPHMKQMVPNIGPPGYYLPLA